MQGAISKVVAERPDHPGESKMYLLKIVSSTFVGRRPTDHVELVDLSEEKKKAQERYNKAHKAGTPQSPKPSESPPLCQVLESHPADLCSKPLSPPLLTSSASSDLSDSVDASIGETGTIKETSGNVVEKPKKLEKNGRGPSSRQLELVQGMSEGDKQQSGGTTKTDGKAKRAPKLGRVISDGEVSTRVQRHPLEVIPEQEHADEHAVRVIRVLQHPLERIDEDSPKDRKPVVKKERKPVLPQPGGRKIVREPKVELKHPPKRERPKPRESRVPITKPRIPKRVPPVVGNDREKPSIANPVMEKMEGLASPEHSWNQKLQNLPKLAVSSSEPVVEERELQYSSPKMTKSDAQDEELSFRVWERECVPKRKSVSVSSDFQDLDLETLGQSVETSKAQSLVEKTPEQLSPLQQLFPATTTLKPVDVQQHCQEERVQHEYPSPSSFTCDLSPTSLFSDDDNIFSRFQQFPDFGDATTPRSVLSDETSHFASDSSETGHRHRHPCASSSTYNDESSDLESPADRINGRSFSMFTYIDKETELTTSGGEVRDLKNANGVDELRYFQEANHQDLWLETDGRVLDDSDLEFLLPLNTPSIPNEHESEITEDIDHSTKPKYQRNHGIPCDDSTRLTRRHSQSYSKEKLHPPSPSKRSVKFASELVQEFSESTPKSHPNPKPLRLPRSDSPNSKDEDERIYPSVKSWEVNEDTDSPTIPPPRRRWRRATNSRLPKSEAIERVAAASSDMSSRRRWRRCREEKDEMHSVIMPCAGRLFSWPQRLAFKVSRSRRVDVSDDDSIAGTEGFGRSARRDALQVRRILKGSQKRFANLTVADILKDNFQT